MSWIDDELAAFALLKDPSYGYSGFKGTPGGDKTAKSGDDSSLGTWGTAALTVAKTLPMVFQGKDKITPLWGGNASYAPQANVGAKPQMTMQDLMNLYKMSLLRRGGGGG